MRYVALDKAAVDLGAKALVDAIIAGERKAIGREHGRGLPAEIPSRHFAVSLERPEATYPAMIAVGEAVNGAVNLYAAGITMHDDYDERPGETWIDVEGCAIYADGLPAWTEIQVEAVPSIPARSADKGGAPSRVTLKTYLEADGDKATQSGFTKWLRNQGYKAGNDVIRGLWNTHGGIVRARGEHVTKSPR